jgi:hypothetical protein
MQIKNFSYLFKVNSFDKGWFIGLCCKDYRLMFQPERTSGIEITEGVLKIFINEEEIKKESEYFTISEDLPKGLSYTKGRSPYKNELSVLNEMFKENSFFYDQLKLLLGNSNSSC